MTKTVIFVQGSRKKEAAFPWMFFHFGPQKDVQLGAVKLVFFDFSSGRRKTWNKIVMKRGKAPAAAPDEDVEITPKVHPRREDVVDTSVEVHSGLAVYDFIMAQPQGSIVSYQVFSHGWIGGPILWDTDERGPNGEDIEDDNSLPRDPNDADFRVRDFFGDNPLSITKGRTAFTDAFDPQAFVKFWGCSAPDGVRPLVQKFDFSPRDERARIENDVRLAAYLDHIEGSYSHVFADNVGVTVWAAPVGWGSDPSTRVPKNPKGTALTVSYAGKFRPDLRKEQWWRVSWFFRNQDRGVRFYERILKAEVDAVDFVGYSSAWFTDARDALDKRQAARTVKRLGDAIMEQIERMKPARLMPPLF